MPTQKSSWILRCTIKMFVVVVACLLPFTNTSAQKTKEKAVNVVRFAMTDSVNIPLKQILANPVLTTTNSEYKILDFTFSMIPSGGEFQGPYARTGSKLDENILNFLREFTNMKVTLFIENIHLSYKGKTVLNESMLRRSIP